MKVMNKMKIGILPAMTFLLAASAGAQIRSTNVPITPPGTTKAAATTGNKGTHKTRAHTTGVHTTGAHTTGAHTTKTDKTTTPAAAPSAATPPASDTQSPKAKATTEPGKNVQANSKLRSCDPKDPTPEGTVVDGYRKVMVPSPLMPHACQWRAVE